MNAYKTVSGAIRTISRLASIIAMVVAFATMIVLVVDIILRLVTDSLAITGSYELTEMAMVVIVFLGFAITQVEGEHVRVTMIVDRLPRRMQGYATGFGSLFGAQQTSAPSQLVFCNGALTNLMTDRHNCGSCGNRCPNLNVCCRGTCFDFWYDENNCGGCGQVCPASMNCCQGTCTDLQSDTHSCGSCQCLCGESEV